VKIISADSVSKDEAIHLIEGGAHLSCPICGSPIIAMPENWVVGMPLSMIRCSQSEKHYVIYIENAAAMHEIRDMISGWLRK